MIITTRTLAAELMGKTKEAIKGFRQTPKLVIALVGNNPASMLYVKNKVKRCQEVGIEAEVIRCTSDISEKDLIHMVMDWNNNPIISAILIQAPLPKHIHAQNVFDAINPLKDVDGFGQENIARLYAGDLTGMIPGTPQGIMQIIKTYRESISGLDAVVIGKSMVVGKPLSMLLMEAGLTVTLCHSKTKDIKKHTLLADIIIVACGKKNLITQDMISPHALVIDVGITVEDDDSGRRIYGDCDTQNIAKIADITAVPGGVGPMTIAFLLTNVIIAHARQGKK